MLIKKLLSVIGEIKKDIEGITELLPDEKKKVIRDLIIEAAMAYGRAKLQEKMNGKI